jgi:hypothetical protein
MWDNEVLELIDALVGESRTVDCVHQAESVVANADQSPGAGRRAQEVPQPLLQNTLYK